MSLRGCGLLVASDAKADAHEVAKLLAREFDRVEVSTEADHAVADFERVLPGVVVLAFDGLDKAQQYLLGLLRLSKVAHAHPHRIVILCSRADLDAVFELCKKDYFDDYVLYWPQAHDGHRLAMTVWAACRRLSSETAPSRDELVAHAHRAVALGSLVDRHLTQGLRHVADAHESLVGAEREVGAGPGHEAVRKALAASREGLAPVSAWARGFHADAAPHVAAARVIDEKVRRPRPVVLVVEDDAFAAKLIGKALDQQGLDIEFASDAPAVLTLLRRIRPAVILMDVNMPGMDGVTLTEWLRASPTYKTIPVIMLTGDARRETIERSMNAGAAAFIVKPFTRENLLNKLARFVH